jgi:hypothetical protein
MKYKIVILNHLHFKMYGILHCTKTSSIFIESIYFSDVPNIVKHVAKYKKFLSHNTVKIDIASLAINVRVDTILEFNSAKDLIERYPEYVL